MTAQVKIKENEANQWQAHYDEVAQSALRLIWGRKLLITSVLLIAVSLAAIALVLIGPRYSGEATIRLNFLRDEPPNGAKTQPIAVADAVALVESTARTIRSRATANAVVARLGLDKDPDFARETMVWHTFFLIRGALGLEEATPTSRHLAASQLMRMITVTNEPRSYLISITVTTSDPERATTLANAVALEYLRGQMLQQLSDDQAAVERELAQLSSVYGVRHPSYALARGRLNFLQDRLTALRDGASGDDNLRLVAGQLFVPAEMTFVPSGPPILLIFGLAAGAALVAGIWLALQLTPRDHPRQDKLTVVGDRTGQPVRVAAAKSKEKLTDQ
ncbi:uncharacterized protein involved in exopolysaccharide biosynthesis [Bradyrhizobium sp. cir1]|uniref:hypothetical protein n=1 Tax=Bradyrhizobium sp. cir1 TaxID=1445730 RepID=UPI00160600CA|nr:hypothetical protein [Bradyrhizobium sp. cir1]MBB4370464.1 uncharacterized protein involved in exopolysaccharide biosynthesis [Bradyrhizobium sp. cir1]